MGRDIDMRSSKLETAPALSPLKGVEMAILGSGEKATFLRITVQPGSTISEHSHHNEQIGTCLEGKGKLVSGGEALQVSPGISWTIFADEPHSFTAEGKQPVVLYEAFSPPREDYLAMAKKK
jgi:quercetin dioxygenase-like cupin family protein